MMYDLILQGGVLVDGSGNPPYCADLAVKDGKIAAIGACEAEAAQVINARRYFVTPGFLDIHRHGDAEVFRPGFGQLELYQGLTTIINGNCGMSLAPFGERHREALLEYLRPVTGKLDPGIPTESIAAYRAALAGRPLPLHVGTLVGGGTLRADLWGYQAETPGDFAPLHRNLERALADGALGVSLGLGYAPECFYSPEDLRKALAPLQGSGVPVCVHMREEGDMVCQALEEMIELARTLRTPVHISHLKAMGYRNWQKRVPKALNLLKEARKEGLDMSCDVYPYTAGSTQLLHLMPPEFLEGGTEAICKRLQDPRQREILQRRIDVGGDFDDIVQLVGWKNIVLSSMELPKYRKFIGKSIAEAAKSLRMSPVDCMCKILVDENCGVTMIDRICCESDIRDILRAPFSTVISDSTYPLEGLPHPRVYGNVARFLEKYVRKERVVGLPQAIQKLTSQPAELFGLTQKGRLEVGMDADINMFRLEEIHEMASYAAPRQESVGMEVVLVAGQPAVLGGKRTEVCAGRAL